MLAQGSLDRIIEPVLLLKSMTKLVSSGGIFSAIGIFYWRSMKAYSANIWASTRKKKGTSGPAIRCSQPKRKEKERNGCQVSFWWAPGSSRPKRKERKRSARSLLGHTNRNRGGEGKALQMRDKIKRRRKDVVFRYIGDVCFQQFF